MLEPEFLPVAEQLEKVAGAVPASDQEDFTDPGIDQRLDRIVDHGPVIHREQVLIRHFGQRMQAGPEPACQHDAFHPSTPCVTLALSLNPSLSGPAGNTQSFFSGRPPTPPSAPSRATPWPFECQDALPVDHQLEAVDAG